MKPYKAQSIEKKWQKIWAEHGHPKRITTEGKYFVLDMFPYPSGDGLHVGHVENYTATDILSRYKRMEGFDVLHPIGWDAFGLPAENFAIKTGIHPDQKTHENIVNFTRQIKSLGMSYDWDREIDTSSPEYYRWTQWMFLFLYKNGLAYKKKAHVNWCPSCQTVLANEQVEGGKCDRCKSEVMQKELEQWFFKITDFVEDMVSESGEKISGLLSGLEKIDWPHSTKAAQRNWIGRSEGALVKFQITNDEYRNAPEKPRKALIIHGFEGHPSEGWKPWLREELEKLGWEVHSPFWPNAAHPAYEEAMAFLRKELADFGEDDVIVGHSLGGHFALKLSEEFPVGKIILVAPTIGGYALPYDDWKRNEPGSDFDSCKRVLEDHPVDFDALQAKVRIALFGMKDQGIPIQHADLLDGSWKVVKIPDAGHMSKVMTVPEIWNAITGIESIEVFTTRVDTIYGCTYVVVAPEHPFVSQQLTENNQQGIRNKKEVEEYLRATKKKTDLERTELNKDKTGVKLEGIEAINPFTGESVPVFVADYVLGNYGTGAVMAVPAHDERDYEFAKKYKLPIVSSVAPYIELTGGFAPKKDKKTTTRECVTGIILSEDGGRVLMLRRKKDSMFVFVGGGIEDGETPRQAMKREVTEETGYTDFDISRVVIPKMYGHGYKAHKDVNCFDTDVAFEIHMKSEEKNEISAEEHAKHEVCWVERDKVATLPGFADHHEYMWKMLEGGEKAFCDDGIVFDSGEYTGLASAEAREKMTAWLQENGLGTKKVNYRLRDWLISRQRYWGAPIPIIYCEDCGAVPVPEKDLPVKLPTDVDFRPTGESPLLRSESFQKVNCPKCGKSARREADTMDTFVCSSWYYLRFADPKNSECFADPKKLAELLPVDFYMGGAEHTVLHLLYARFFTKALAKYGYLKFDEPFAKLRHQGMVLAEDGRKMSKSLGNVVNPDEVVGELGADTLRLYEMFMGPLEDMKAWNTGSVVGLRRFLERVWRTQERIKNQESGIKNQKVENLMHKTIKKVTDDIENLKYNTAISSLMICLNELEKEEFLPLIHYSQFLILLSPFAPHIAEEIWDNMGNTESIFLEKWPQYDEQKMVEEMKTIVIQVNGKVRANVELPTGSNEATVKKSALADANVQVHIAGKEIRKVIYIQDKILNVVV